MPKKSATPDDPKKQKAFFLRQKFITAFEDLAYSQKRGGGKGAPELQEQAVLLLLKHYGVNTDDLEG